MSTPGSADPQVAWIAVEQGAVVVAADGSEVGTVKQIAGDETRDIRELGLEKAKDSLGRPRYVAPHKQRRLDPREGLAGVLAQFARRATSAQNLVVVASELGTAPAIGRAIDRVEHDLVVGTVAGDDTLLVVTKTPTDARALARELSALIG